MNNILQQWRQDAKLLKVEVISLYFAYQDKRTPWYARVFAALVVGYAFSPLDLIPDFIPILGLLDDLILLPLGIRLALGLIPPQVMADSREKARLSLGQNKPKNYLAAGLIILLWLGMILLCAQVLLR